MKTMEGKVALVTGAAQGIGFATAKAFAEAGASVVLANYVEDLVNKAALQNSGKSHPSNATVLVQRCS